MSTLTDRIRSAIYRGGEIVITTGSGEEICFPVSKNPRLATGSEKQLQNIEISPFGLHWPDLDEDLSLRGILNGNYGQENAPLAIPGAPTKNSR
jgi:hypothetical protein